MTRRSEQASPKRMGDCSLFDLVKDLKVSLTAAQDYLATAPNSHVAEALSHAGISMPIGRILVARSAECATCETRGCDVASLAEEIEPFIHELPIALESQEQIRAM